MNTKRSSFLFYLITIALQVLGYYFGFTWAANIVLFLACLVFVCAIIVLLATLVSPNDEHAKNYSQMPGHLPKKLDKLFYLIIVLLPVIKGHFFAGFLWAFVSAQDIFVRELGEKRLAEDKLKEIKNLES